MKAKTPILSLLILALFNFPLFADPFVEKISRSIIRLKSTIPENARTASSLGTEREGNGVVIDQQGHILTVGYLILEAESVEVTTLDGKIRRADVVGYDHETGFGLLRAAIPSEFAPLKLGKSPSFKSRDPVLVASFGGPDYTQGAFVISRLDYAGYWEYLLEDALFVAPAIDQFGGAALIDRDGSLIGIGSLQTRVDVSGYGAVYCNVYIPVDKLKPILDDLVQSGHSTKPPKPWLGMYVNEIQGHVVVIATTDNGPSEQAGIQPRDIILAVQKAEIAGLADFYKKVWSTGQAGVEISITVLRKTRIFDVTVKSDDRSNYFKLTLGRLVQQLKKNQSIPLLAVGY